jgi:hypothetical protein
MLEHNQLSEVAWRVQGRLDELFPSPEGSLSALVQCFIEDSDPSTYAELHRLALDVEDLIDQMRWHMGQAMIIRELNPEAVNQPRSISSANKTFRLSSLIGLGLTRFAARRSVMLCADSLEPWKGGTIAGWQFHMMLDGFLFRAVAVLDRLATIAIKRVGCMSRNDKIYFRSRKIAVLHESVRTKNSEALLDIASSDIVNILIDYRDGLSHRVRPRAFMSSGFYVDSGNASIGEPAGYWQAGDLLALAGGAYEAVVKALEHVVNLLLDAQQPNGSLDVAANPTLNRTPDGAG